MGLTACGQYMISHRVVCNDNTSLNHYSFNVGYKYTYVFGGSPYYSRMHLICHISVYTFGSFNRTRSCDTSFHEDCLMIMWWII